MGVNRALRSTYVQILGRIPAIYSGAPVDRVHRCNDFCRTECEFCGKWLCRDDANYERLRVGDSGDFTCRCETCQGKHARGEMEEAV